MKPISLNVSEPAYNAFKHHAANSGLTVSELIRRAMDEYIDRQAVCTASSLNQRPRLFCNGIQKALDRSELFDEMIGQSENEVLST